MAGEVARRLEAVRRRIAAAARRAARDPGEVTLVGVSKTVPAERIREAFEAGLTDLAENRVQEAREKIPSLPEGIRWHLVGHLQRNKANHAAGMFRVVHSIDSVDILARLERAAARSGRSIEALVQVDLAGEEQKFGVTEGGLDAVLEAARSCRHLTVRGLMVLPPYAPDPEA
ncbi:MAG: YggS family pyridoxal phosphate-dependent enzyme, partial [Acidobacteriota bacterium]